MLNPINNFVLDFLPQIKSYLENIKTNNKDNEIKLHTVVYLKEKCGKTCLLKDKKGGKPLMLKAKSCR